jgi:hypothetical protein
MTRFWYHYINQFSFVKLYTPLPFFFFAFLYPFSYHLPSFPTFSTSTFRTYSLQDTRLSTLLQLQNITNSEDTRHWHHRQHQETTPNRETNENREQKEGRRGFWQQATHYRQRQETITDARDQRNQEINGRQPQPSSTASERPAIPENTKKPVETMDSKGNTAASKDIKSTASKDIESQRVREPNGQGVANAQENLTKQVEPYRSKHSIAIWIDKDKIAETPEDG